MVKDAKGMLLGMLLLLYLRGPVVVVLMHLIFATVVDLFPVLLVLLVPLRAAGGDPVPGEGVVGDAESGAREGRVTAVRGHRVHSLPQPRHPGSGAHGFGVPGRSE
eukprot:GHVU01036241.1.p2 GENE.GHVU01036241.1~~GHVU01036241.1.p2  ORF type:complete len:106 (+),score=11.00 GHVU01036241.1:322-639(+)